MRIPEWSHEGRVYRIIKIRQYEREHGYAELSEEYYNVLQVKLTSLFEIFLNSSRWRDVEKEHIPSHVWISSATLGYSEWKSSLLENCRQKLAMP